MALMTSETDDTLPMVDYKVQRHQQDLPTPVVEKIEPPFYDIIPVRSRYERRLIDWLRGGGTITLNL